MGKLYQLDKRTPVLEAEFCITSTISVCAPAIKMINLFLIGLVGRGVNMELELQDILDLQAIFLETFYREFC